MFNKYSGSITDSSNLFSWLEDTSMSSRNDTKLTPLLEIWGTKAIKKKSKIKSEFSFNHVSTEIVKRIINDCV